MVEIGDGKKTRKARTQKAANVPGDNTRFDKQDGLISVGPDGEEIPTGRKPRAGLWGDIDPPNTRMYELINGDRDISTLSDEELSKGYTLADDGKFSAHVAYQKTKRPKWVKDLFEKELVLRAESMLAGSLLGSMDTMVSIATGQGRGAGADLAQQAKAAQWVVERTLGKTPERVAVSAEKPFELLFSKIEASARHKVEAERLPEIESDHAAIDGVDRDHTPVGDGDGVAFEEAEVVQPRMHASRRRGVGHPEDHADVGDAHADDHPTSGSSGQVHSE